ncbi:hypothetical protein B0J13DRAFT_221019 [Dactylonectria estremocensis]|uniref:Uncharacterized protein n=1 Tax=Dactylonectria estremocensis TaxID=1079267 RepID=A0A9P9F873_9HYPO|nr:hypothetical protein B0J13DRAFT_221019 [Dactylonectria estremocensis]
MLLDHSGLSCTAVHHQRERSGAEDSQVRHQELDDAVFLSDPLGPSPRFVVLLRFVLYFSHLDGPVLTSSSRGALRPNKARRRFQDHDDARAMAKCFQLVIKLGRSLYGMLSRIIQRVSLKPTSHDGSKRVHVAEVITALALISRGSNMHRVMMSPPVMVPMGLHLEPISSHRLFHLHSSNTRPSLWHLRWSLCTPLWNLSRRTSFLDSWNLISRTWP